MKRISMICFVLCFLLAGTAHTTTYYVSKRAGSSDSNNGKSWDQAWSTVSKVNSTLQAGDTVLFGSGVWYNSTVIPPTGGLTKGRTVYACSTYTTASARRTTISGGTLLPTWTQYSGSIYYAPYSDWGPEGGSNILTQADSMLWPQSSLSGVNSAGKMFEDVSNNRVYAWCLNNANPNTQTMVVGKIGSIVAEFYDSQDKITFFGLILSHGNHCIVNTDSKCDSNEFKHCTFRFWGGMDGWNSSAWLSQQASLDSAQFSVHCLIQACSLYCGMADPGKWRMYVHTICTYSTHRVIIDSCVLHSAGLGAKFKDQAGSDQHYGRRVSFCTIYNMDRPEGGVSWEGHHVRDSVFGNVIYNCAAAISDMGCYASGGNFQGRSFICNNTIYDQSGCCGITFCDNDRNYQGLGTGNEVKYNIIYGNHLYGDGEAMGFGYTDQSSQAVFGVIDSNMYFNNTLDGDADVWRCLYSGQTHTDWTNWRDATKYGFDLHGTNNTNPNFANPSSYDFARPGASTQMNRADYGNRQWTVWGAVQPSGGCDPPGTPSLVSPATGSTGLTQPVTLDWSDVSGATMYEVVVDDNSDFSSPVVDQQPSTSTYSASGLAGSTTYYWRVRAYNSCGWGSWSSSRYFTTSTDCTLPGTPSLVSPAAGATGLTQPITLDWGDVSGATMYEVVVDDNSDFSSPAIDQQPTASTYSASGLASSTTYYWRARAYNACGWGSWSSSRSFTTYADCTLPGTPSLVSPAAGATGLTQPITLDWGDVTGATMYEVVVDDNSDFSSPAIDQQPTASTYSASGLASSTTYYWRARAYNSCGWGSWSSSRSFTTYVDCTLPGAPTLVSPTSGVSDLTQPIALDWNDVSGATSYQVQVDNNSGFGSPEIDQQPTTSTYSASGLSASTTYYWRVRAYNSCGWGSWSLLRNFATAAGCTLPGTPTLVTPATGATGLSQPITLDWGDVSGATLYEVQVDNSTSFTSPEVDNQPTLSTTSVSGLTASTTYYWRARAYNSCGWGSWSAYRSFTTSSGCPPPGTPVLTTPADGAVNITLPVRLDWHYVSGATQYQVQVDNASDFTTPLLTVSTSQSQYDLSGNFGSQTTFYWRIRAYNSCGWGAWASPWHFSTADMSAPVISGVHSQDTTSTTAWIHWTTNENSNSQAFYLGEISAEDSTPIYPAMVTDHLVQLTGLLPNTLYEYYVQSRDAAGNIGESGIYTFRTAGLIVDADDQTAPKALGESVYHTSHPTLVVENPTAVTASKYTFEVATDSNFVNVVAAADKDADPGGTTACKIDTRLSPGEAYYWRALASSGNYSNVCAFTVTPEPHSYPDPFDRSAVPFITITELPQGSSLYLTTVSGETVKVWKDVGESGVKWDGTNESGRPVAPGVYLWYVDSSDIRGKLTVIN